MQLTFQKSFLHFAHIMWKRQGFQIAYQNYTEKTSIQRMSSPWWPQTKPDWFLTCTESMRIGSREAGPRGRISNSGACGICWVPWFCAIARHSIDALLGDFLSFVFAASLESHFAIACNWKGLFGPICFVGKKYIYSRCDSLSRWGSEEVIQVSVM